MISSYYLPLVIEASIKAGQAILDIYTKDFDIEYKEDNSPLTTADKASHIIINNFLKQTDFPVLSEEGDEISFEERKNWNTFWVVDPLDGTKEFIKKNGEFTVNIALVKDNTPILGVIYVPVDKTLYFSSLEKGSYKAENITEYTSFTEIEKASLLLPLKYDNRNYTIVASRSHLNEETKKIIAEKEKQLGNVKILSVGSSLKLCMIAENRADIYPRFGPTMEWDIAAGHAIVKYAGGSIIDHTTNLELLYNKENLRNPYFTAKNNLL